MTALYIFKRYFSRYVPLSVGMNRYSVILLVVFTVVIVFSSSFIVFSSNTVSSTTLPTLPINDSSAGSNTPILLWNYTTNSKVGAYLTFWGVTYAAPIIAQNTLYFASADGHVYALNAVSGTKLWKSDYELSKVDDSGHKFPVVDNNKIFVCGFRRMHALDANNGTPIWETYLSVTDCLCGPPVIVNGILYAGTDYGTLRAFDTLTGDVLWTYSRNYSGPSCISSSPLVIGDVVYGGSFNTVFALDAQSGSELWNRWIGSDHLSCYGRLSSFIFDDGLIYFCTSDGDVYALEADGGKEIWNYHYALSGVPSNVILPLSPVLKDGLIYVGSGTGDVCALNASDGTKLWASTLGTGSLSVPALYGDVLYFGSSDGNLW